jgi:solute:Na+ symporter, SSS family
VEINIMVAALWWLGMKWRRANSAGAWASMATAAICFFLIPALLPFFRPSLRTDPYLLKTTQPIPIARIYRAHEMDVELRQKEIARWEAMSAEQKSDIAKPRPLAVGEEFAKTVVLPSKSIFWTKGIKPNAEGMLAGSGFLSLELVVLDRLGFDLSRNTYAMNETVRVLIRAIFPFAVLIAVSLLTRPEDKRRLDRFFVKMQTEVREDREEDERELELSYADPGRFRHKKLFPNSQWEFCKWNRVDTIGFLLAFACVFAVLGFFQLLLLIGS